MYVYQGMGAGRPSISSFDKDSAFFHLLLFLMYKIPRTHCGEEKGNDKFGWEGRDSIQITFLL